MTDSELLRKEMERTGLGVHRLYTLSGISETSIKRILRGYTTRESTKNLLFEFLATVESKRENEWEWLRQELVNTGMSASMLRNHTGTSRDVIIRIFEGKNSTHDVYERLSKWVRDGKPSREKIKHDRNDYIHDTRECGEAFVRRILMEYGDGCDYFDSTHYAYHPDQRNYTPIFESRMLIQ